MYLGKFSKEYLIDFTKDSFVEFNHELLHSLDEEYRNNTKIFTIYFIINIVFRKLERFCL